MRKIAIGLGFSALLAMSGAVFAAGQDAASPLTEAGPVSFEGTEISFALPEGTHNVTVRGVGPRGFMAQEYFADGIASLDLSRHGELRDGRYQYEMTGATSEELDDAVGSDNGRSDNAEQKPKKPITMSGGFEVARGAIMVNDNSEQEN